MNAEIGTYDDLRAFFGVTRRSTRRWLADVGLAVIGRFAYSVLIWLLLITLFPMVWGWRPTVVSSGSMAPAIRTGDVLLSGSHDGEGLGPDTVALYLDPVRNDVVAHRVLSVTEEGQYITRGDANPGADSTPVDPAQVEGVGRMLVPYVGLPAHWLRTGNWFGLALFVGGVAMAVWLGHRHHLQSLRARYRNWSGRFGARRLAAVGLVVLLLGAAVAPALAAFDDATDNIANTLTSDTLDAPTSLIATPRTTVTYIDAPTAGTYYYVARAYASNWESVNSNEASATVPACTGDTGFQSPSGEAADTGGDNNGFEGNAHLAFADSGGFAENWNGPGDRHRFSDYGLSIPAGCSVSGIEVQLDWWMDSTWGSNSLGVELSWDGGASWTAAQTDITETTVEHTFVLGGAADTWGRTWSVSELADADFRVRVTSNSSEWSRDFFLDWVPVRITFAPPPAPIAVASGTITPSATEAEIVGGAKSLIITLTNETWDATIGADNSKTTDLIDGIDSAQAEATGWDAVVKANMDFNDVVRTSDTVVTITLPAFGSYNITATEIITVTVPATAVVGDSAIVANPTFAITSSVSILDPWTTGTTHAVSAGSNRLLLVAVYGEDGSVADSVNTVSWGGQTLTEINEVIIGTGPSSIAWLGYLDEAGIAAASGNTIIATWSGFPPNRTISYAAVTLENVDQTTPVGGSSTGTALNAGTVQPTGALGVDPDDLAVYVTVSADTETHTAATGYTEGVEQIVGSGPTAHASATAHKAITTTGSEQPIANWSNSNARLAIISTVIHPN